MDISLAGKVAVVTGAASGMGAATARLLAAAGAVVVPCDWDRSGVEQTAHEIEVRPAVFDVTDPDSCRDVIARTVADFGGLDVVVNAAGVIVRAHAWQTSDSEWRRIFAVNVDGTFFMSRSAVPAMRERGGGSIVNFGSIWGSVGAAGTAAYTATKGAVHQLTRSMALEHARENIRVNAVCPGEIDTPMLASQRSQPATREYLEGLADATVPMGRLGRPEEVARVVVFLASDHASYMTGALVNVDAGYTAR